MNRPLRIILILLLFAVLVGLRAFADVLFYDPLADFFRGDFQAQSLPEISILKLLGFTGLRYLITALISLAIIQLWFQNKSKTLLAALVLAGVFILFCSLFWIQITLNQPQLQWLFYTRRILIQPLVLILLIPAFYYQMRLKDRSL